MRSARPRKEELDVPVLLLNLAVGKFLALLLYLLRVVGAGREQFTDLAVAIEAVVCHKSDKPTNSGSPLQIGTNRLGGTVVDAVGKPTGLDLTNCAVAGSRGYSQHRLCGSLRRRVGICK